MIEAIQNACLYFSNYEFGPNAGNTLSATYAYYYSVTSDKEEGIITVYVGYYADQSYSTAACAPHLPVRLDYDTCYEGMHTPIDHW